MNPGKLDVRLCGLCVVMMVLLSACSCLAEKSSGLSKVCRFENGVASPGCARHGKAGNVTRHRVNNRPSPPKGRVSTVPTGDPACSSGRTPVTWNDYTFFTITRSWAVGRATNTTGDLEFNADACSLIQGSLPNPPVSGDFGLLNYTAYVDCGQFRLEFDNNGVTVTTELDLSLDPAATLDNLDLMSTYSMVFGSPALAQATTCEVEENTMAVQPQVSLITFTGDEPFPLGFDSTSGLLVNQTIGEPSGSVAVNLPFNPARQLGDSFKLRCYTLDFPAVPLKCCDNTNTLKEQGTVCRASDSPCAGDAVCNGVDGQCPNPTTAANGTACPWFPTRPSSRGAIKAMPASKEQSTARIAGSRVAYGGYRADHPQGHDYGSSYPEHPKGHEYSSSHPEHPKSHDYGSSHPDTPQSFPPCQGQCQNGACILKWDDPAASCCAIDMNAQRKAAAQAKVEYQHTGDSNDNSPWSAHGLFWCK